MSPARPEPRVDFIGIGSQKAATTWLFRLLKDHPDTRFPVGKEFHFWDVKRYQGMTVKSYVAKFDKGGKGIRQGEITPAYAILDSASITDVARALPKVRLFCTLRNPLARAWSAMEMVRSYAWLEPAETSDQFYLDLARSENSMRRGNFVRWLANWQASFPPSRLKIIDYEAIVDDPRAVLVDLARYLRLDPDFYQQLPDARLHEKINARRVDVQTTSARPVVVEALRELYKPLIGPMSEIMGRDVSYWLDWDGAKR